jgi:hypothetical protein
MTMAEPATLDEQPATSVENARYDAIGAIRNVADAFAYDTSATTRRPPRVVRLMCRRP